MGLVNEHEAADNAALLSAHRWYKLTSAEMLWIRTSLITSMASVTASVQVPSYAVNLDRFPGSICQADTLVRATG